MPKNSTARTILEQVNSHGCCPQHSVRSARQLTEGVKDTEREQFRKRVNARVSAALRDARATLDAVEKEAAKYHEDLSRTWTYSGDFTRLAEDLEAMVERFEYLK